MTCLLMVSVWKSLVVFLCIMLVMAFEFWFEYLQLLIFTVAYVPLSFKKIVVYWLTVNCIQQSKIDEISGETTSLFAMIPWE